MASLEPTFGGINLEDIKAPECFYVEQKLRERMKIPVFHDDQHGTAIIAGAGLCVTGLNIVLVAVLGIIYPTAIRSMGTGFTQAAGRVGALAAPIVGGLLIDLKVPLEQLTLAPAGLLALGAVASSVLTWRCYRAFGGIHLTEFPLPATAI